MIKKISSINSYLNLQEKKIALEKDFIKARNGKDPNCKKCDEKGNVKIINLTIVECKLSIAAMSL